MPTQIILAGGEPLTVTEALDAVVSALEGHAPDTPALPAFTREDGSPVHVRPGAILYVTPG